MAAAQRILDLSRCLIPNLRWYDPATGRWQSEDLIGFAGGLENLSDYVGNSPTNGTDPSGLEFSWGAIGRIAQGVGEGVLGLALGFAGAGSEAATGGISTPASVPAMAGGSAMFFHGLDTASAGFNDLFGNGGPPTQTVTSQAIQGITGDRASADYLDNGIGLIGGLAGGAALSKFATCPSRAEILTQGATEAGAAAKLAIKEGDSLLAIVENGKIVKWSIPNTSHEALAKSAGVFVEKGVLKEGAEAVTIIKQGGKLYVQNSHNFGGAPPASEAACRAANELFK